MVLKFREGEDCVARSGVSVALDGEFFVSGGCGRALVFETVEAVDVVALRMNRIVCFSPADNAVILAFCLCSGLRFLVVDDSKSGLVILARTRDCDSLWRRSDIDRSDVFPENCDNLLKSTAQRPAKFLLFKLNHV